MNNVEYMMLSTVSMTVIYNYMIVRMTIGLLLLSSIASYKVPMTCLYREDILREYIRYYNNHVVMRGRIKSTARHYNYHSKIPAASAISTSYECYIRNWFKSFFRAIKTEILRHSP